MEVNTPEGVSLARARMVLPSQALFYTNAKADSGDAEDSRKESNSALQEKVHETKELASFVLFAVQNATFMLPVDVGIQLIDVPKIFSVPNVHSSIAGIINVRGDFIPVCYLAALMGEGVHSAIRSLDKQSKVLVFGLGEKRLGVFIQSLPENVSVDIKALQNTEIENSTNADQIPKGLKAAIHSVYIANQMLTREQSSAADDLAVSPQYIYHLDAEKFAQAITSAALVH